MLLKGIRQLNRWGVENIQLYCKGISEKTAVRPPSTGILVEDEEYRSSHLFGIRMLGKDSQRIKEALIRNKVYVSFRGEAIRVSPHVIMMSVI